MNNSRKRRLIIVLAAAVATPIAWAQGLPDAQPRDLGFSAERLSYLDEYYSNKVKKGEMAGIVLLVARHGKVAHLSAIGYANTDSHKPMQKDSIFRLYSMTKPIAATALMMLYEEGKFQLDDPIAKYIPEFAGIRVLKTPESSLSATVPANREPTIHDLFRHTAGFMHNGKYPATSPIDDAYTKADLFNPAITLKEVVQRLAKLPLHYQPGTKYEYSIASDVQARLVEVLSGRTFEQFVQERLFKPLRMQDSGYLIREPSRLVPVHWFAQDKLVPCNEANSCPDDVLNEASNLHRLPLQTARTGGSYGLVGTAEDYWRFAQMMANGGELNGQRLLSPSTVRFMVRDHLGAVALLNDKGQPAGLGVGLGFAVVKDTAVAGSMIPDGSYFWAGAAGTFFWIDPANDIVVVAMTQILGPKIVGWPTLREQVGAMVYGALIE